MCELLKQHQIEHKCIELLPEHRFDDSVQAQIFTQSQASDAVITVGPYLPALFTPFVSESRVSALADLLGLFYIAQAGVVGAYMGVSAWMSRK